jgi:hypothetical protein
MQDSSNVIKVHKHLNFEVTPNFKGGGYYPETRVLKAITDFDFESEVLDVMTAAAEASMLHRDTWVKQLFADDEVFGRFMEGLAQYDQYARIHDRWYFTLFYITDAVNEEGFVTSEEIVERMLAQAMETGQI